MGEMLLQQPAAISSNGEPTLLESKQSASPAPSDKTVTAPPVSSNDDIMRQPQPGRRSAIFSTDIGRRARRGLQQPGFFQPIARSNLVEDAIIAAGYLRKKYPYQYSNVFPQQGWQIDDLWDDHDIQIEGEGYFTEVLRLIERDNVIRVQQYACEYAEKCPERLALIGGDIAGLYNKTSPLSIVDKIFVNGESRDFPPSFLWKVAHFLRTSMLTVKAMTESKDSSSATAGPVANHRDPVVHSAELDPASVTASASVPVSTSNTSNAPTPVIKPAPTMPNAQAVLAWHQERHFARATAGAPSYGHFGPSAGLVGGVGYTEPTGNMMPVLPAHHAGGPNMAHAGVHVPRTRLGRSASGSYSQIMQVSPYVENMPRVPSGFGPRQHASPMSATQSPRLHPAHMVTVHPMGNVPPNMLPLGYDQDPMGHGTMAGQPHPTGVMHPGAMPSHAMQGPPMMQGYPRQPSNAQGPPFTMPMGDMTNMHYGVPPGMPMQNMGPRRRLSQQHANGNSLYDPYEGNNQAFRNTGYLNGKKYSQGSMHNISGRQRKASFPGSRPYHGQYINGRPQTGASYNFGPKPHLGNDPSITQDREYGCFVDWIGPQNEIVNELFVKDLPEDVGEAELEGLFQERRGVRPTSISLRCSPQAPQRKHAFVRFPTCAIAKQALVIPNPAIRGYPVSITVPKRFFQRTSDVPSRDTAEAYSLAFYRYASNPNNREGRKCASSIQEGSDVTTSTAAMREKPSYSPQDARSDMPKKKKKGKQTQQAHATAGSPEARKAKPKKQRQGSPTEDGPAAPTMSVKTDHLSGSARSEGPGSASTTVEATTSTISEQTAQQQAKEITPSTAAKENMVKPTSTEAIAFKSDTVNSVAKIAPSEATPAAPASSVEPAIKPTVINPPQQKTTVAMKTRTTASASLEARDPASDDELKNEASFHSAAESQSELEVKEVSNIGPEVANHGTDVRAPETSTTTTISTPAPFAPTTHTAQEIFNAPTEGVDVITIVENSQLKQESKATIMPPATSDAAAEVFAAKQQEPKTPTTTTLVVSQTKKSGPQQTESLFVGPKQLKAQAKREKEQKKKAQKKEKLAKKGKNEDKHASDRGSPEGGPTGKADGAVDESDALNDEAKSIYDVESVDTTGNPSATAPDAKETSVSTKKPEATETSQTTADSNRGNSGRVKCKKAGTPAAKVVASTKNKNKDHGKQTDGTSAISETDSVTKKDAKANPQEDVQETSVEESTQERAPSTDAQSSKQDDNKDITGGTPGSERSGSVAEVSIPFGKNKNKNKKKNATFTKGEAEASKQRLAWPNVDFRPKSPNPAWMGPIDMETDTHNFEKIITEALGGPDDSDFSWSDLPTMEDVLISDEGEIPADSTPGGSEQPPSMDVEEMKRSGTLEEALLPKITMLRPGMAAETFARLIKITPFEEIVIDDAALATKVDEVIHPNETSVSSDDQQIMADLFTAVVSDGGFDRGATALVAQQDTVDRGLAALETRIVAKHEERKAADADTPAHDMQLAERSAGRDTTDAVSPGAPPAKKKKANKHKNKKNKKKAAENDEASKSGDTIETTGAASTPSKAVGGPIDPLDPFVRQLQQVDALIDLNQNDYTASGTASLRGGAATPTDEQTLMRTMEAYFREAHPERRIKGRKVSQQDLQ
ncbi:hypothetical protein E8E12_011623 [Didymella heteroderae]|uniref:RRM domain-containing protein n=1 Tax=Didymella heteroderae TaxID=1769908 RepID=A0A9P4X200_9PLEO|nr:hypothetical protein E8E12_011623 [Didymella heteroderae]